MIMQQNQQQSNEELCNLFIQSLETKDDKTVLKILECDDEETIKDVINRIPVHHVRKLVIALRNVLSEQLTTNHLRWLQQVLVYKFSALASMADNRSIILPLISLLDDRSSPAYYMKLQALKGKISLLKQLKETRDLEVQETVVRIPIDRDQPAHMEVDSESDTDSDEDIDNEEGDDNDDDDGLNLGRVRSEAQDDGSEDQEENPEDEDDQANESDEDI